MTPDDQRRQFYQEQAEYYGYLTSIECEHDWLMRRQDIPQAHKNARLAGHFGRLALGETECVTMWSERDVNRILREG